MSTAQLTGEGSTPAERSSESASLSRFWRISIIATAAAAMIIKLLLAAKTYGTNDVYRYEAFMAGSHFFGAFIYRAMSDFNHPPSMIHVLRLVGWLTNTTGWPFQFWLRVPGILADAGSVWVLWKIIGPRLQERSMRWALLFFAAAPTLLLISGFHGNTDTIMTFFLLISVYFAEKDTHLWVAGAMFGLSMCFKITPVITAPAMFFYLRNPKKQIVFFATAGGVLLSAWSPYIFQDTRFMLHQIFGYRSIYGHWGLSYLSSHLVNRLPIWGWPDDAFKYAGSYVLLGGIAFLSYWMNRSGNRPRLYSQIGMAFFLFLSLTNAFGVQYLAWLVPWVVGLGVLPAAIYLATSGAFLFLVYNYWSEGIPWYMADSYRMGDYQPRLDFFQIACWLSVMMIVTIAWKQMKTHVTARHLHFRRSTRILRFAGVFAGLALVIYLTWRQASRDSVVIPWPMRQARTLSVRAAQFSNLSLDLYHMGRYRDAIAAARESAMLRPDYTEAFLNLAASYAALNMWEEAVQNAQEAFRLQPDSPLVRSTLDGMLQKKERAKGSRFPAESDVR